MTNAETRVIVQQKDENGEFQTISVNRNIVGVIFDEDIPKFLISDSTERMTAAAGAIAGYVMGREEALRSISEISDKSAQSEKHD
jgi:hypothetical protein